ncbi:MAG TPA: LON peptidase substrate-binding domain-containing protein [Myxococcota bacterium]
MPLFPLANVVLFPGVQAPLHIFEPRYRQMTEHTLAGDRKIGMVAVRPERVDAMAGDPPVFGVGCEGRITDAKRLPDGRFNLLLLGTQRFRILSESAPDSSRLYRVAEIERLEDAFDAAARPRVLALRHRAIELVAEIASAAGSERPLTADLFRDVDDVTFVNALANAFAFASTEKQGLLEASSVPERYERLISILGFQAALHNHPVSAGSDAIH